MNFHSTSTFGTLHHKWGTPEDWRITNTPGGDTLRAIILLIVINFVGDSALAQTITEKILRENPSFTVNMGMSYESNLQKAETYQNQQATSFRIAPRYRLSDSLTLVGATGMAQSLTQENRTDMTNTSIGITHSPYKLGKYMDFRPTLAVVLPTNEYQREKDSLRGALQITGNTFFKTLSSLILGVGARARLNTHQYSVSAQRGANIQTLVTPFLTVGGVYKSFELISQSAHTTAWTYRGNQRRNFDFDLSLSYTPSRQMSFTLGHNNRGSVLARDGVSSNVQLFNRKTSVVYLAAFYNF